MAIRTLKARSAMLSLLPHPTYTLSRLKAQPLGAPHVARFEALKAEGRQVLLHELDLVELMAEAQARVVAADDGLNVFASRVSKAILTITSDDRANPLYKHFFAKPLNALTKPMLGAQLETMRKWQLSLSQSQYPSLSAMAPELTALIAEADGAAEARDNARQQMRAFRDVGERQQWVDRLNAGRKETHGALAKLPHENPGLPIEFADQFFLSDAAEREAEGDLDSLEALRAEAASLREALAQVEASLAQAEASGAEAQRQQAAAKRAAQEAALAELDRAAEELAKKRAEIQAQLEGTPA